MKKSTFNQMTNPSCSERDWNGGTSRVSRGNAILYSFLPRTLLVLITLLTLGVGQMWAAQTYKIIGANGNLDNWSTWKNMTVSTDGFYEYFQVASGDVNCKINTATSWDGNEMGESYISYNFNCTNLGSGNSWSNDGNVNFWYNSGSYYIICYYPNTAINTTSSPIICASTTLPRDYAITVATASSAQGTVSPTSGYATSSSSCGLSITASPKTNYAFVNWTVTSGTASFVSSTSASTTVSATAASTVTANFAPQWTLKGGDSDDADDDDAMGNWETFNNFALTSGTTMKCTLALAAKTTYSFKIVDRRTNTWYGNNSAFMGQTSSLTMNSSHGDCHITTAKAGNYIFTFDNSEKTLTVTYPTETHPSVNYIYFKNTASWSTVYAHMWNATHTADAYPGPALPTFTFNGGTYYYAAIGSETTVIFGNNDDSRKTGDLTSANTHTRQYYEYSSSSWKDFTVSISYKDVGNTAFSGTHEVGYPTIHTYGTSTTLDSPTKDNYTFSGWFQSSTGTSSSVSTISGTAKSADFTLYAKWSEITYDVTATKTPSAGGSVTPTSWTAMGVLSGGDITATPNTGYTFGGWAVYSGSGYFGASGTSTTSATANTKFRPTKNNTTIRATFTPKTITVTLDKNGGNEDGEATVSYNASSLTSITHASRASYSLNGYYTASSGGSKVINADGSLNNVASWVSGGYWCKATDGTLYAQWTYNPTNYEVTYDVHSSGHGTLSAANTSTSAAISSGDEVTSGTGVTFTASPSTGYTVDGWFSNEACTSPIAGAGSGTTYSTTITAATSVYVKFKEQTWSVAFAAGAGGTVTTPNSTPRTVGQLTGISIAATPSTGYTFNTWTITSGSGSFTSEATTNSNTFKPTAASTVTASFTETMSSLSTSCSYDAGDPSYSAPTVSGSATNVGYATTRSITAASASTGYTFTGWTLTNCTRTDGGGATANPITIRSNGDGAAATVVANYEEDLSTPYTLNGGSAFGGSSPWWNQNIPLEKQSGHSTESVGYYTASIASTNTGDANSNFQFKIVENGSTWNGITASGQYLIRRDQDNGVARDLTSSGANIEIRADVTGDYLIKVDYSSDPTVTVYFPLAVTWTAASVYSGDAATIAATVDDIETSKSIKFDVYAGSTATGDIIATWSGTTSSTSHTQNLSVTPSFGANDMSKQYTVKVTYDGSQTATYTSYVYRKWDIYVQNNCEWASGIYYYGFENGESATWPGTACAVHSGIWYKVTLDGKYPKCVLNNNNNKEQTNDVTVDIEDYEPETFWDFKYTHEYDGTKYYDLESVALSDPTVTLTTYDVISTTQIYVKGTITNFGNDGTAASDMQEVGFKIGETKYTTTCTSGSTFERYITGLTANTSYSVKAYATNLHGTGESAATAHTTRATGNYTIKVRTGVSDPVPYIRAFTWSDEGCGGTGITENASGNGVAMTLAITGTVYKWYTYSLSNEYQKFYINENASSTETWDQTAPLEETCYWYHHGAAKNDRFGSMDCPYTTPHLMIEDAPGGTFVYQEMTGSGPYSKTVSLSAKSTYKFKPVYNAEWYGKASTKITRASNSASSLSASVEDNLEIETDAAGDYTFTFTAPGTIEVTYPDAHTITFGAGAINGSNSVITVTASPSFTSGDYVLDETAVTFNKGTTVAGYDWKGWYSNNDGTGTCHSSADANWTSAADTRSDNLSVYACYTYQTYSITYKDQGGSAFSGTQAGAPTSHTYNTATTLKIPTKTGYTFGGWFTASDCASGAVGTASSATLPATGYTANITLYAKWTANTWYVRFNANSGTGSMSNESFTYDAAAKALTTNAFTRTGYTYQGWATTAERANAGTVDYADEATVRNLTTTADGIVDLFAVWNANEYTVSFDVNGGTASTPDDIEVTYDAAYGELPGGMTHASKTFAGWYTDPDDGEGDLITAESIVSIAENHTLYARYEDTYRIDVSYKCGDANLYPATSVNASPTVLSPTITAPEILGYNFTGWEETGGGSYVTFADDEAATTTITTTGAATIVANYSAIPTVYFKNNLGWEKVYVTFDCNWVTAGGKSVPSNNTKPYFEMTQLGTSDIYSCVIPDAYITSAYAGWKNNIAFDNHGFAASDNVGTNTAFNAGEFLGRGDFDPSATMYIPYDGDSETRNSGTYYRTGCWMKYNSTDPGYKVYVNTYKEGSGGSAVDGTPVLLKADVAGGFEFKAKVSLGTANYTYGFMLHKEYTKNSDAVWYTNIATITAETDDLPWHFYTDGASENGTRCGLKTESTGDYEFTVSFGTGRPVVDVTYPVSVGDWRLAYNDRIAWSGSAHGEDWYLYSRVVKAEANAEDIVSFYVSKAVGANAHVELQKCTAINPSTGAETWVKQGDNLDLSEITGTGIYNFKITQDGSKVASAAYDGAYSGNFYIRTDASDGGWTNYKTSGTNTMTYSEYAEDNSGFTHYYMRFVTTGSNIKFCIANDYSPCLTEYCVSDTYTNEWIEANGNVRFMWDHRTNVVSRAYISGSSVVSDRFLVLEGDAKMFDEDGNALTTAGGGKISGLNDYEMKFIDDQNWIYEATVKAQPTARIKLTAKYNDKIQYFYGEEGARTDETTVQLIGGKGSEKYKVRVVYDFKTNRLITAFIPDGDIGTELAIDADLMIIREHQGEAQQVTFTGSGKLSKVKTVYGAMKFNKYTVNGKEKTGGHADTGASRYERDLFYISFPFDVKLSDAFGFGTYGKHWIIEYYDGKGRAANGFWADSPSNWKFVMPSQRSSFTMKAFEGYILALDLDEMTESSSVWNNGVEDVYIYFPSSAEVEDIQATDRLVTIDQEGYECTINRPTADGDRRIIDSYWHCIGVPSFANYSSALKPTSGGSPIDWSDDNSDGDEDQWTTPNLPYLYEWVRSNNTLSVTSSATFNFKATWSYLVQYAGSSIYWEAVNATPAGIVARRTYEEAPTSTEFCIELQQEGNKADQTFVRLTNDENVTSGFDFNYDLSKEFNRNKANIYTMVTSDIDGDLSTTETAGNCLPMSEQTTIVPMGVQIAKAGEYTISIPSGTNGVGVTLIDNETGLRTNLALEDYRVELDAATYNSRFIIEISPIVSVLTGVEQTAVSGQPSDVRKVIIDQKIYIIKDGKVYDAQGARVR